MTPKTTDLSGLPVLFLPGVPGRGEAADLVGAALEVRNGSEYGLYKICFVEQVGVETNRGLLIKLRRSFAIRAQYSDDTLVLGVEVQDAATRRVLFKQQAGQNRTIRVSQ